MVLMENMEKRVDKLEIDVDDLKVRMAVAESNIDRVQQDISDIKNDTKFIKNSITGSIISVIIACIIWVIKQGGI